MDRSLGFGSMPCNSTPCSDSVSLRLRDSYPLTSLHSITRRLILQKARRHPKGLRPLVGPWFQVLFHSPPGVLFTFPSRYYALSVAAEYLALEGGPPGFRQDSTCPAVLRYPLHPASDLTYGAFTLSRRPSQAVPMSSTGLCRGPYNPGHVATTGLGSSPFARRYWGNLFRFLFLLVLRWFTSQRIPSGAYVFSAGPQSFQTVGLPHSETPGS